MSITGAGPKPKWIGPVLHVTSISPGHSVTGKTVETTVFGTFFAKTITCELVSGETRVPGTVSDVVTGQNSSMRVKFSLGDDIPAGLYGVEVANDAQSQSTLPDAFEVRERALA